MANKIDDEDGGRQRAILLTVCGSRVYSLMKHLIAPAKITDKSYDDLTEIVRRHQEPRQSLIVYRYKFYTCNREAGQTVSSYIANLRRLAEPCEFGVTLEEMLRDRLVLGINDDHIQRRLLAEDKLDFKKAVDIARSMQTADMNLKDLSRGPNSGNGGGSTGSMSVNKFTGQNSPHHSKKSVQTIQCYRCLGSHKAPECRYKETVCHNCGVKGHLKQACRNKNPKQFKKKKNKFDHKQTAHKLSAEPLNNNPPEKELTAYSLYKMNSGTSPINVEVKLNDMPVTMELDTGASLSIMSESTFNKLWSGKSKPPLSAAEIELRTYTGELVDICGKINVNVSYGDSSKYLPLLIVAGTGPNLFGRDWLEHIKLNWHEVKWLSKSHQDVIQRYPDVFKEGLGTYKGPKAKIYVDKDATPLFYKARSVPYMLREKIEEALDRDINNGVMSPVETSEWAAPIVPVLKRDGETVRVCGDYKMTVNKVSSLDNYPIPKEQDLFACLAGGEHFTKLDMSNAYQQMELDQDSKKFTAINTHKGLFVYNRLPFGIKSAPGIFQRQIENLLKGIPHTIVRLDDILITGVDRQEHLSNLDEVLKRLSTYGLRLRKDKCVFYAKEVVYLGKRVTASGLSPTEDKVEAVKNAPAPTNLTELKSFLGLLNYYCTFLPDIATVIEPLNRLMRSSVKWQWTTIEQTAFDNAKNLLCSSQTLIHYNSNSL